MTQVDTPPKAAAVKLRDGYQQSDETFDVSAKYLDAGALEKLGQKKKGRLGKLIWEFETADVINNNRRLYPAPIVAMAVQGLQERIAKNVVFGNLDHPSAFDFDALTVMLSDAAVKVGVAKMISETRIHIEVDILDNPEGRQLVSVLEVDGNPAVSQRAIARFRDPTDAEREKFKIPDDEFIDVAESLRLITYDVVSEPGFSDAGDPVIRESKGEQSMPFKNTAEILAAHPDLHAQIVTEGKTAGLAEAKTTFDAERTKAVEDALKPVNEKLAAAETAKTKALEVLSAMKPALIELGIVNEKITDVDAATRVSTAEAKLETAQAEKKALETKLTAAEKISAESALLINVRKALETVSQQYTSHPAHDHIMRNLAKQKIPDVTKALEVAKAIATEIEMINPALKPGADKSQASPAAPVLEGAGLLNGLLKGNNQNPEDGSGGAADENAGQNEADENMAAAVAGGFSFATS